jgi:hypothetical protein
MGRSRSLNREQTVSARSSWVSIFGLRAECRFAGPEIGTGNGWSGAELLSSGPMMA